MRKSLPTALRRSVAPLATTLLCAGALAVPIGDEPTKLDHAGLAADLLERHGYEPDAARGRFDYDAFFEKTCLKQPLGLFDVAMPIDSAVDVHHAQDLGTLLVSLVDVQSQFVEWLGPKAPGAKELTKDLATVRAWAKSLKPSDLATAAASGGGLLTERLETKDKIREALERVNDAMRRGTPLGQDRLDAVAEPVVLVPDRKGFLELVSLFGWTMPSQKPAFWHDGTVTWTNTYFNDWNVLAMQFQTGDTSQAAVFEGVSMNSRTPTGLQQQIGQLCANAMLDNYYGSRIPPSFAGALAVNLVVEIYGECNTRVDGDLSSRRTEAREVFVPGGQSEGGVLPANLADSRWRRDHGAKHFAAVLRGAQKAGAADARSARAKGKVEHFQLMGPDESERTFVSAPFLGSPAVEKAYAQEPLPNTFYGDELEFSRSYRSCFAHWLQRKGASSSSKSKSAAAFGELLRTVATSEGEVDLESSLTEVYGKPLSSAEPSKKDLEGSFLAWLAKQ